MRRFIRHPTNIPIEISTGEQPAHAVLHVHNLGECGLAFRADRELAAGTVINVRIPHVQPVFETAARVSWCRGGAGEFELGVEFVDVQEAFRARMVEQVCYIENYRNQVYAAEGRRLTPDQAAIEWVSKYAAQFPGPDNDPPH